LGAQANRSISVAKAIATIVGATEKRRFSLKAQAEDLSEARKALESAANIARGLSFTFLTLAAGVVIAAGTVTHRELFLETPVHLPLLNAQLPMVAFFWFAPLMFLVFHGYLLLNLVFLSENVQHYFGLVDDTGLDAESKDKLYLQLPNFMMVQLLRERRQTPWTLMGYALHIVVTLVVVIGPALALLFLQLKFLPYHSAIVTMVQRMAIVADTIVALYFWPQIVGAPGSMLVWLYRVLLYAAVLLIGLFSAFVAAFPGEWSYGIGAVKKSGMTDFLFRGVYNEVTGARSSWFSDTLLLSDQDFVELDTAKLKEADKTVSVRGRDFVEANFSRSDLRKVDFSGANLAKAVFESAHLQGAFFAEPSRKLIGVMKTYTKPVNLQDSNFNFALLDNAVFDDADMRRASLRNAELSGTSLDRANLRGANIEKSNLDGAKLRSADLSGALVRDSNLSKANLANAILTGTLFDRGHMQFAVLDDAKLNASAFIGINVRGLSYSRVGWGTTLVKDLRSIEEKAEIKKDDPGFSVASLSEDPSVTPGPDPSLAAGDIMKSGINALSANPLPADFARWHNRAQALLGAICGKNDFGFDVFKRVLFMPGIKEDPQIQFGPFKSEMANAMLDSRTCPRTADLQLESKGLLTEWAKQDYASEAGPKK
jgi:uncharacterized protein YjbI with pentapeptide repeats